MNSKQTLDQFQTIKQLEQLVTATLEIQSSKEEPMYNKELDQKSHLQHRLCDIVEEKIDLLRDKYHLIEPTRPKTLKELKERLAKGEYTIDNHGYSEDYECRPYLHDFFSWRTVEPDLKGFEAAREKMEKAKTKVVDQIYLSYEDGLAALQAFENETFH
jgi:hypothetical protein